MFHISGIHKNLQNIVLACRQPAARLDTHADLKAAYNRSLAWFQPCFTVTERPEPEWVTELAEAARLASLYKNEGGSFPLDDETIAEATARQNLDRLASRLELTWQANELLHQRNPALDGLFDLAINRLFFFDLEASGGGSSGNAIGIIWANPKTHWSVLDVAEFLVRELTHHLLFLEEAVCGLFQNRTATRAPRRLNLCLHHLIAGVELLLAREQWLACGQRPLAHLPSDWLLVDCRACLNSIRALPAHPQLFSANGQALMDNVDHALSSLAGRLAA
jgi:hypothetical protein